MQHLSWRWTAAWPIAAALAFGVACSPPPAAPAATAKPAAPAAAPTTAPAAPAATTAPAAAATTAPAAASAGPCKVAQIYTSPTADKGWGWEHEESFRIAKSQLAGKVDVDLSIRKDSVNDQNQPAVQDLIETMIQQGAKAVYTTSFGFMEPTREQARKHPDVAFFHASGFPSPNDPPNIGYYFATIEEGRYITGEVAGLAVPSGANLGYLTAFPIPEVFRGANAFALGVKQTNPTAKIHTRWTLTWFDLKLEKEAGEALADPPVRAELITHHEDSPASLIAAQEKGKLAASYQSDMTSAAPNAILTGPRWNWSVYTTPTIEAVCSGAWTSGGRVSIPAQYNNYMGTMKDGMVQMVPLNTKPLENNPNREQIEKVFADEVAAFKSGEKNLETIFTGTIKDNEGTTRIDGKPDISKLYDDNGQWFVDNIVGTVKP